MLRQSRAWDFRVLQGAGITACLLIWACRLSAQTGSDAPAETRDTTIVPGAEYSATGFISWLGSPLFGSRYRTIWRTPLTLPILDLNTEAGGLRGAGLAGGREVGVLYLAGANGEQFEFWPLNRLEPRAVPSFVPQSLGEGIVADLVSGRNPAGPLVAAPLADAAGVPNRPGRLVVLPDDSALGVYRQDFANQAGYLVPRYHLSDTTDATPDTIGTILSTQAMFRRLVRQHPDRVDAPAVLQATLFNIYLGVLDPVWLNWRWRAERDSIGLHWVPLGLYREEALSLYDGIVTYAARSYYPDLVKFGPKYKHWLAGLPDQTSVYRWVLGGLEPSVWDSIGADLQSRLTDSVITAAVSRMPPAYQEQIGGNITRILRDRRDNLPHLVKKLYQQLNEKPALRATDGPDLAVADWVSRDSLRLTVSEIGGRTYTRGETEEVDLFLRTGDDTVDLRGTTGRGPLLRIIPGHGITTVRADSAPRAVIISDPDSVVRVQPPGSVRVERHHFREPLAHYDSVTTLTQEGLRYSPSLWFEITSGVGVLLGGGVTRTEWNGETQPFRSRMRLRVGYGTAAQSGAVEFAADYRWPHSPIQGKLYVAYTGLAGTYFYGIGNDTPDPRTSDYYLTKQKQFILAPAVLLPFARRAKVTGGLSVKSVTTPTDTNHFVAVVQPYGTPRFGEAGVTGQVVWDTRDVPGAPRRGLYAIAGGAWYPLVWSGGSEGFGVIQGAVSTYLTPPFLQALTIATRVAGSAGIGTVPYFELPFIGGGNTVRGLPQGRYEGDQAVYANLDFRLRLTRLQFVMPWDFGILALADVGRVFVSGQSSDVWHPSYGGGVWVALLDRTFVGNANLATGAGQGFFFRLGAGFIF